MVSGYTDNTGNPQLNQTLSQKRAESVRNWMRDTGDVPESCFAVQGYGESRPVATNDTPEGRALNRRVEISLVPQAEAGLTAIRQLKKQGIPTLGTVVYTAIQGLMAAMAGADYVAPYVNRVDTQGGSGIQLVSDLQTLLEKHAPSCQVLAASFKTPRQALDCMLAGTGAITLPLDVVQHFLNNPAVDAAVSKFEQDWQKAFGRISLS